MDINGFGLKFHHFGLAVRKPESAFRYLSFLGYRKMNAVYDPLQHVNLAMWHHAEMPDVEVIWPGDEPSPIQNMLKREDARIYHQCYSTDDPDASIAAMKAAGLEVLRITPAEPAVLFGGLSVSFYGVGGVGLIELLQSQSPDRNATEIGRDDERDRNDE